jgi:glutaredoxin-like protein NrdH
MEESLMTNKITLFSKNNCMQCKMTKKLLDKEGADYQEINIDEHPDMVDYVKSLGFTSAPVIKAGDISFSGFQPSKLKEII